MVHQITEPTRCLAHRKLLLPPLRQLQLLHLPQHSRGLEALHELRRQPSVRPFVADRADSADDLERHSRGRVMQPHRQRACECVAKLLVFRHGDELIQQRHASGDVIVCRDGEHQLPALLGVVPLPAVKRARYRVGLLRDRLRLQCIL